MNIWFVRWAQTLFFSREFVIAPFEVVREGNEEHASVNLARMLNARLGTLQRDLHEVRRSAPSTPSEKTPRQPATHRRTRRRSSSRTRS